MGVIVKVVVEPQNIYITGFATNETSKNHVCSFGVTDDYAGIGISNGEQEEHNLYNCGSNWVFTEEEMKAEVALLVKDDMFAYGDHEDIQCVILPNFSGAIEIQYICNGVDILDHFDINEDHYIRDRIERTRGGNANYGDELIRVPDGTVMEFLELKKLVDKILGYEFKFLD